MSVTSVGGMNGPDGLVDGFVGYLRRERGVSELTVEVYAADVQRFLGGLASCDLNELTPAHVSGAVLARVGERSPATVRRYGCALRSFLRYCFITGLVAHDLSGAALPVSGRRRSLLPQGLTPAQEKRLLGSCDRRRARGRRDYAVILVIVRLGLRASEVAMLRLDDIDWRAGQLTVRGKGDRIDELPLPADVGEAIAGYLCRGRPRSVTAREVFLRTVPPPVGLSRFEVSRLVEAAARGCGLGLVRPHRLRHTAATDMLRAGASLPEIGQVLRHRSLGTTAIYARVDVERLRAIARPWPSGTAS